MQSRKCIRDTLSAWFVERSPMTRMTARPLNCMRFLMTRARPQSTVHPNTSSVLQGITIRSGTFGMKVLRNEKISIRILEQRHVSAHGPSQDLSAAVCPSPCGPFPSAAFFVLPLPPWRETQRHNSLAANNYFVCVGLSGLASGLSPLDQMVSTSQRRVITAAARRISARIGGPKNELVALLTGLWYVCSSGPPPWHFHRCQLGVT